MALGYVRPARPDEADEIARIQLSTWRTAYRRLLPRHVLDEMEPQWLAQRWRAAVEAPPSDRHRVLVAVEQAGSSYLVGFAAIGPADEAALAPGEEAGALDAGTAAITELLVEPRWGRRGHGSRLLAASVDLWREDGFGTAVAWAYERDAATLAFLTGAGWAPDGAHRALDVDDLLVPQRRLHVALGEADDEVDTDGAFGPHPGPAGGGGPDAAGTVGPGASGSVEERPEADGEPGPVDD